MADRPWPAPAKLNRFLHIVGRRADGMHELQTLFQFLDYSDQLHFSLRSDAQIRHLNPLPGLAAKDDLTVRAAQLLQREPGSLQGVDIRLDKQLPMGGGLGGGSSDCATTLVALNRLWNLNLSTDRLAKLGLQLGADVPVFVHGQAAWAEGVGERLTPLQLEQPWFVVIRPDCEVSTRDVFNAPDLTRSTPPTTIRAFLEQGALAGGGGNDCEAVVRRQFPAVAEALDWLAARAPARLTGTGACIFAAFAERESAERVQSEIPDQWQGFVARGCNESPLLERLQAENQ